MNARYDMLVVDLDGTLLNSAGEVSPANIRAIDAARAAGLEVIIATGRSHSESREALQATGHVESLIAAGGSLLCEGPTGRTINRRTLGHDVVRDVTGWLVQHEHPVLLLKDAHACGYDYLVVGDGELDPASRWWFERMGARVRKAPRCEDDQHPHDTIRAGAVADEERLAPLASRLREAMGERCCMQHCSAVTATHATGAATHLLEIFDRDVNKWSMLEQHCAQRGIDVRRVAAIGDGLNDVELIANAGLGVAMANAGPAVHAVASRVTTHHDDDGVAHAVRRILSGEW